MPQQRCLSARPRSATYSLSAPTGHLSQRHRRWQRAKFRHRHRYMPRTGYDGWTLLGARRRVGVVECHVRHCEQPSNWNGRHRPGAIDRSHVRADGDQQCRRWLHSQLRRLGVQRRGPLRLHCGIWQFRFHPHRLLGVGRDARHRHGVRRSRAYLRQPDIPDIGRPRRIHDQCPISAPRIREGPGVEIDPNCTHTVCVTRSLVRGRTWAFMSGSNPSLHVHAFLPASPVVVDAPNGNMRVEWRQFLAMLWERTGGTVANPPGTGTITGVVAGHGLTGGGASGTVTLTLVVPIAIADGGTGAGTAAQALLNLGAAPIASPVFTGSPVLPAGATGVTAAPGDNDTSIATTAFVQAATDIGGIQWG